MSAFSVGLIFMFTTAFLMFLTKKLEKNIKKDKTEAINRTGKAYTNFAPHSNGQIEIEINGQLSIENAFNLTAIYVQFSHATPPSKLIIKFFLCLFHFI